MLLTTTKPEFLAALDRVNQSKLFFAGHSGAVLGDDDPATNKDRELVEVYRFEHLDAGDCKEGYSAYWTDDSAGARITTWTSATIAWVTSMRNYTSRGAALSERVSFRALGIDGREYAGTYYKSSGNYVRMKAVRLHMGLKRGDVEASRLRRLYRCTDRSPLGECTMRWYNRRLGRALTYVEAEPIADVVETTVIETAKSSTH